VAIFFFFFCFLVPPFSEFFRGARVTMPQLNWDKDSENGEEVVVRSRRKLRPSLVPLASRGTREPSRSSCAARAFFPPPFFPPFFSPYNRASSTTVAEVARSEGQRPSAFSSPSGGGRPPMTTREYLFFNRDLSSSFSLLLSFSFLFFLRSGGRRAREFPSTAVAFEPATGGA